MPLQNDFSLADRRFWTVMPPSAPLSALACFAMPSSGSHISCRGVLFRFCLWRSSPLANVLFASRDELMQQHPL
eukprot:1755324-Rhodomonas_salina.1